MSIPPSFIQDLLTRVDVVEVVGRYVQLKKGGANFMGLCPFHGEKSPSFSVSPAKQFYHCFGCGANGNAISFLMEHVGMGFIEAVKDLAQQAGMQVPEDNVPGQDRDRQNALRERQRSLTTLLDEVAKGYQKHLKTSARAIAYLKGRGLSGEVAKQFGLGYSPEGWRSLASMVPDYSDARLVDSGLVIAPDNTPPAEESVPAKTTDKRYDRFRDRIMFPIRNVKGETIGFGGRVLDKGEPKYLNSPETPVFSKGRELYGLFEARTAIRTSGFVLVTEGYMDVVALAQLGFANAVATLGTACTPDHVQKLFRFTDSVVFSFDGDAAGRRAAGKAMLAVLPFAQDTRSIKFLFLPPEHDPDSYIRANGTDAFAQCIQQAMPLSQFLLETAAARCDLTTAEGRALMASHARPLWTALPEGTFRRQLLGELAKKMGLEASELANLWNVAQAGASGARTASTMSFRHDSPPEISVYPPAAVDAGSEPPTWEPVFSAERPSRPRKPQAWTANGNASWRKRQEALPGETRASGARVATRVDVLARLLLSHPVAWEWLTADDLHLLGKQVDPLGSLFRWLDSQWHEHGPQPWAALRSAMTDQPFESAAIALMSSALASVSADPSSVDTSHDPQSDTQRELREILQRMHIDDLKLRCNQALAEASHQPQALQTYRELAEKLKLVQQEVEALNSSKKL